MNYFRNVIYLMLLGIFGATFCLAQPQQQQINAQTQVSRVKFRGNDTFSTAQLSEVIATQSPTKFERVAPDYLKTFLRREDRRYFFNPFELQKDLTRLERFYNRNGFLTPSIAYIWNWSTSEENAIDILFNIEEGLPLLIQTVAFVAETKTDFAQNLPIHLQRSWQRFQEEITLKTGLRLSELALIQIQQETIAWLQNHGYAYATMNYETQIDSTANRAGIQFQVNEGMPCVFGNIEIRGLEHVSESFAYQLLTFKEGDAFSYNALTESKRKLFEAPQFRIALFDIPEQEKDSTVDIIFEVREANLRLFSGQAGYDTDKGFGIQGKAEHRNFLGKPQRIAPTLELQFKPSFSTPIDSATLWQGSFSVAYQKPQLFTENLTFLGTPFIREFHTETSAARAVGMNLSLVYQLSRFRTISFQNALSRIQPLGGTLADSLYSEVVSTLTGSFGQVDNFLNRTHGFLITPTIEVGGLLRWSDVNFFKVSLDARGYWLPFQNEKNSWLSNVGFAARLFGGVLRPNGNEANETGFGGIYEDRYDDIRFYAGGKDDVRGWRSQWIGYKYPNPNNPEVYEPNGGLKKIAGNLEVRFLHPSGIGGDAFFDFGQVWDDEIRLQDIVYAAGTGIRYATPWGVFRLELSRKLKQDPTDVVNALGNPCNGFEVALLGNSCGAWHLDLAFTQAF